MTVGAGRSLGVGEAFESVCFCNIVCKSCPPADNEQAPSTLISMSCLRPSVLPLEGLISRRAISNSVEIRPSKRDRLALADDCASNTASLDPDSLSFSKGYLHTFSYRVHIDSSE